MDSRTAIVSLILAGCGSSRPNYTAYALAPTSVTPGGIPYAGDLDAGALDFVTSNVLACIPTSWGCRDGYQHEPLKLDMVLGAPWHTSPCSGEELLDAPAPDASCEAKGLTPTEECGCYFRAVIQDSSIATTPNLKLFPGALTSLVTGCDYPWEGALQACAQPE